MKPYSYGKFIIDHVKSNETKSKTAVGSQSSIRLA